MTWAGAVRKSAFLDESLNFKEYINRNGKTALLNFFKIKSIQTNLSKGATETLVLSLVIPQLDLHFKEHILNFLLTILKKLLIVGSSAPSHLVFGILRFRTNIWYFINR